MTAAEITCVAMRMVWNEPLVQKPEPTQGLAALLQKPDSGMTAAEMAKVVNSAPESLLLEVAKQMADEEDATRKREESAGSKLESTRKRARTLEEKGPDDAIGPQLPGMEHVAIKRAPDDAKAFDMDYLDSTSRWRVKLAGAEYMRGGPQEQLESEKRKGKDGKGKGGGKGGGKGKGKGKGKKGKGKKGKKGKGKGKDKTEGDADGESGDDGQWDGEDYDSGDDGGEYEDEGGEYVEGDVVMPPASGDGGGNEQPDADSNVPDLEEQRQKLLQRLGGLDERVDG